MKKYLTKLLVLVFVCILFASSISYAASTKEIKETKKQFVNSEGQTVSVTIPNEYKKDITDKEIEEIINAHLYAANVIIEEIGIAGESILISQSSPELIQVQNYGAVTFGPLIKKYTAYSALQSDRFIASAARGQVYTATSTKSYSLSPSITGTIPNGSLNLAGTASYVVYVGSQFSGPPNDSAYNSREFRCKFYENRGTWSQVTKVYGNNITSKGTFKEPVRYASYSFDRIY
ncbi:hypothetical protein [Petrocella sp. FN5]|uniref:hypothetical protein n=1 Tax=Petrocella sp. FN5 TaxID=3032002 RepID=UPI0023D98CB9|nr:hypothetical protein [Petrocella sp. FN5]MDF1616746.1 hypothetical protein [Petrocella sp. FN5]